MSEGRPRRPSARCLESETVGKRAIQADPGFGEAVRDIVQAWLANFLVEQVADHQHPVHFMEQVATLQSQVHQDVLIKCRVRISFAASPLAHIADLGSELPFRSKVPCGVEMDLMLWSIAGFTMLA